MGFHSGSTGMTSRRHIVTAIGTSVKMKEIKEKPFVFAKVIKNRSHGTAAETIRIRNISIMKFDLLTSLPTSNPMRINHRRIPTKGKV